MVSDHQVLVRKDDPDRLSHKCFPPSVVHVIQSSASCDLHEERHPELCRGQRASIHPNSNGRAKVVLQQKLVPASVVSEEDNNLRSCKKRRSRALPDRLDCLRDVLSTWHCRERSALHSSDCSRGGDPTALRQPEIRGHHGMSCQGNL